MTDNLSAESIKKTQDSLGKFVKKPPLTEKLLKKPPFKFLHDIINVVIRDTNFLDGLFTPDELQAENIKDREAKMKFLQKLIDTIKLITKQDLSVKTSKIVAGLEPEKTNQLLQAIGMALENNLDSKEAIERIKKGPIAKKPTTKTEMKSRDSSKPPPAKVAVSNKDKESKENKPKVKPENPAKKISSQRSLDKVVKGNDTKPVKRTDSKGKIDSKDKKPVKKVPSKEIIDTKVFGETVEKINGFSNGDHVESPQKSPTKSPARSPTKSPKKSPAKVILKPQKSQEIEDEKIEIKDTELTLNGDHKSYNDINGHESEPEISPVKPQDELAAIIDEEAEYRKKEKLNKKLARQKTVEDIHEKAPEIIVEPEKVDKFQTYKRESVEEKTSRPRTSLRPPSARPASARPAAPRRRDKNVEVVLQPEESVKMGDINVKMESFSKELEDDGENLVIIEDPTMAADNILVSRMMGHELIDQVNENEEHGHLVKQILETQKEFSGALGMTTQEHSFPKKTEIEFDESSAKQVEVLKDLIQKLTRSVNPMGKLMDFIQEDIDSMQREYTKWYELNKKSTIEIRKEQSITASAVEPLKHQLSQLEISIKEQHEIIDAMRATIVQNEQKIFKIFTEV